MVVEAQSYHLQPKTIKVDDVLYSMIYYVIDVAGKYITDNVRNGATIGEPAIRHSTTIVDAIPRKCSLCEALCKPIVVAVIGQ